MCHNLWVILDTWTSVVKSLFLFPKDIAPRYEFIFYFKIMLLASMGWSQRRFPLFIPIHTGVLLAWSRIDARFYEDYSFRGQRWTLVDCCQPRYSDGPKTYSSVLIYRIGFKTFSRYCVFLFLQTYIVNKDSLIVLCLKRKPTRKRLTPVALLRRDISGELQKWLAGNQNFPLKKRTIVQPFCIISLQVHRQCFLSPDFSEILLQLKAFKMSGADFYIG